MVTRPLVVLFLLGLLLLALAGWLVDGLRWVARGGGLVRRPRAAPAV